MKGIYTREKRKGFLKSPKKKGNDPCFRSDWMKSVIRSLYPDFKSRMSIELYIESRIALYWHDDHHSVENTHLKGDWHCVEPVYPLPPHWPHWGTEPPGGAAEVGPVLAVEDRVTVCRVVEAGGGGGGEELPRSATILARYPVLVKS